MNVHATHLSLLYFSRLPTLFARGVERQQCIRWPPQRHNGRWPMAISLPFPRKTNSWTPSSGPLHTSLFAVMSALPSLSLTLSHTVANTLDRGLLCAVCVWLGFGEWCGAVVRWCGAVACRRVVERAFDNVRWCIRGRRRVSWQRIGTTTALRKVGQ